MADLTPDSRRRWFGLSLVFAPLWPSKEQRMLRKELKTRPKLDDKEFYEHFYRDSGVSAAIPIVIRRELEMAMGLDLGGLLPHDNLQIIDGEIDLADVFFRLKRVFSIEIPRRRWHEIDGTFDSLVNFVAQANPTIRR